MFVIKYVIHLKNIRSKYNIYDYLILSFDILVLYNVGKEISTVRLDSFK